jgi:hypothetical protein
MAGSTTLNTESENVITKFNVPQSHNYTCKSKVSYALGGQAAAGSSGGARAATVVDLPGCQSDLEYDTTLT